MIPGIGVSMITPQTIVDSVMLLKCICPLADWTWPWPGAENKHKTIGDGK